MSSSANYSRLLNVAAIVTACAIFPLVFVGAGVTSKDAGMAFPGWPKSNDSYVNPDGWWQQDDTRWEHGHRLIGWMVGMLSIVVALLSIRAGGVVRWWGPLLLFAIIVQGVAGGMRVREVSTTLAMLHGIWGQLCFALACFVALASSRAWIEGRASGEPSKCSVATQRLCVLVAFSIFVQLVFGAALRHYGTDTALAAHLVWVIGVSFVVGWATLWIMANHADNLLLVRFVQALALLLALQLMLGAFAFLVTYMEMHWSPLLRWLLPTAHVAVGALLLALSVLLAAAGYRFLPPTPVVGAQESLETRVGVTAS